MKYSFDKLFELGFYFIVYKKKYLVLAIYVKKSNDDYLVLFLGS